MGDDGSSDLLIFKLRDSKGLEETEDTVPVPEESSAVDTVTAKQEKVVISNPDTVVSAKGLKCSIHPWRDAYAVCSKCGLPYCYVDIVKKNGKFVCIDDIESVEDEEVHSTLPKSNMFTGIGGIFLVFNAAYLLYMFYPQAGVVYHAAYASLTLKNILNVLQQYYYPDLANFAAIILSVAAGLITMANGRRRTIGVVAGFLIFMLVVYEFMNSIGAYYLVLPVLISFLSIIMMVLGNMSAVKAVNELVDDEYRHVEWPRPEVF